MDSKMPFHGADPLGMYRTFGVEPPSGAEILDFSTNSNVVPFDGLGEFDLPPLLSLYPDTECSALRGAIAEAAGASPENVLPVNGSNEAFYLLASYFAGGTAYIREPVYGEYRRACEAFGMSFTDEPWGGELCFICSPCNPTGAWTPPEEIEAAASRHRGSAIVVDEAYIDFLRAERREIKLAEHPNIIILRSLTKIFNLCGIRIGYVLAGADWIARLRARQPHWSVNSLAIEAAMRYLAAPSFVERTRSFFAAETPRFIGALVDAGLKVEPTSAHFFLIYTPDDDAAIRGFLERGIAVRHTRNFRGLDGRYIRVSTKLPEQNDRFIAAARELIANESGAFGGR